MIQTHKKANNKKSLMGLVSSSKHIVRGESAPDFTLKNVDGKKVSLSDFKGQGVVVIFICNHCPYVISKMEEIGQLAKDFSQFAFICINSNNPHVYPEDSFVNMKKIAKKYDYQYYLVDDSQDIAKAYGAVCTPDPFIFDAHHSLVYHGRINDAMNPEDVPSQYDMRNVLSAMLLNDSIDEWFVPSTGCSIKWKT